MVQKELTCKERKSQNVTYFIILQLPAQSERENKISQLKSEQPGYRATIICPLLEVKTGPVPLGLTPDSTPVPSPGIKVLTVASASCCPWVNLTTHFWVM